MTAAKQAWVECYKDLGSQGLSLMWPSETLVRCFKGNYIPELYQRDYTGESVLSVGCGTGNNLVFLGSLGLKVFATEIDEQICAQARATMSSYNFELDARVGFNTDLPFEDDSFDYLVSWNVLHYEPTESLIELALKEYARVLKPNGRILLSTTGPEHQILKDAKTLGGHRYQIGRSDDFRNGETYFYFDQPRYIEYYFSREFENIRIGRTHDQLFDGVLDWFIVTAVKPR
jgi:SAM-dependent methyltransferase